MDKYIYGGDTETIHGKPMTLQFYSEHCACDDLYFVSEKNAAKTFLEWCGKRHRNAQHVVYIHNLAFDLPELLYGMHEKLVSDGNEFAFSSGGWSISGVYGTPTFCRISKRDIHIILIDSYSYFRGSLDAAAKLFCPHLPKLKHPAHLGEVLFKKSDENFCEYAMRDAVVAFHIGEKIEAIHQQYDLQQSVSVADMASRIFRHHFLTYTIPQPTREVTDAALLSYHGGKNNITVGPGWYTGVNSLDIKSAYPDAMQGMPAFSDSSLYRQYKASKNVREKVPDYGVYQVTGNIVESRWPCVFSHGFKPLSGDIDRVWLQGFEVNEGLRSGKLRITRIRGTYYDAEHDHQAPALRAFVDTFFALKENEKDRTMRTMQKFILNSISGKFIQTKKRGSHAYTDIDAGETVTASDLVAAGMFHPFIASAITAHTRARIHRLETHYSAIHTATDGIFTQAKIGKGSADIHPTDDNVLGALSVEAKDATALILRNKCYVLYTRKDASTFPSTVFKGKHIKKYALHGFQGRVSDLEKLVANGHRKYEVKRPNRLKESIKRGLQVNDFVSREYILKVGNIEVKNGVGNTK